MKILYLAPQPFFTERGTPIRTRNIIAGLIEGGHSVDLLCYPMGASWDIPGLTIRRMPKVPGIRDVKVGPSLAKFPLDFLMLCSTFFRCLFHRYDVIEAVEEAAFFAAPISWLFRIPLVYNMDSHISDHLRYSGFMGNRLLLGLVRWIETRTMRRARLVVTVAESLSRTVHAHAPQTNVLQLEDAPLQDGCQEDPAAAARLRAELNLGDGPLLVYTGNMASCQGIELLMESAPRVKRVRPDLRYVLVGGKPLEIQRHAERARHLGVEDRFVFAGIRPVAEMPGFLTLATLLASPRTAGTNTPMKVYNYMQSRRPLVATDLPTHTSIMDRHCAVLTAPTGEDFARGILWVLDHPVEAARLAEAAAARIEERYSLPIFKQRIRSAYQGMGPVLRGFAKTLMGGVCAIFLMVGGTERPGERWRAPDAEEPLFAFAGECEMGEFRPEAKRWFPVSA